MGRVISLLGREHEAAVYALLTQSQIHLDPEEAVRRAPEIAAEYESNERYGLWGFEDDDELVGLVGIEWHVDGRMRLMDIAVTEHRRGDGIGRALIRHLQDSLQPLAIGGVTLTAVVPFYRATGFKVEPFGAMPNGEVRYSFLWRREAA